MVMIVKKYDNGQIAELIEVNSEAYESIYKKRGFVPYVAPPPTMIKITHERTKNDGVLEVTTEEYENFYKNRGYVPYVPDSKGIERFICIVSHTDSITAWYPLGILSDCQYLICRDGIKKEFEQAWYQSEYEVVDEKHYPVDISDMTNRQREERLNFILSVTTQVMNDERRRVLGRCIELADRVRDIDNAVPLVSTAALSIVDCPPPMQPAEGETGNPPVDSLPVKTSAKPDAKIDTRTDARKKYDSLDGKGRKALKQTAAVEAVTREHLHTNIRDIEILWGLPPKSLNRQPYKGIIKRGRAKARQETKDRQS